MTDREALRYALRDVDIVSHQAAYQDYMPDFSRFLAVNAVGTALLYELIVEDRMKIRKVIVASSQAVYGEGQYVCQEHGGLFPSLAVHNNCSEKNGKYPARNVAKAVHPHC